VSAEAKHIQETDDDLDTTAPQSKPGEWKMPEPVFRRTSGRLPKGFEDTSEEPTNSDDPSPDLGPTPDPTPISSDVKPESGTLKIVVVALGLAAMIAFIVVLMTVVYFFFLR
jgi:hypothetical protein